MKKVLIPLAAALMAAVMALGIVLPVSANGLSPNGSTTSLTLDLIIHGRKTAQDVGDVVVTYDGTGHFSVVYTITDPNWALVETHVYLALSAPTKSAPGKFLYTDGDTITLTLGPGATVCIAGQAELQMVDPDTGVPILDPSTGLPIEEGGWAQSSPESGIPNIPIPPAKNWATYVEWVPAP
jgi:hypothetical protein